MTDLMVGLDNLTVNDLKGLFQQKHNTNGRNN